MMKTKLIKLAFQQAGFDAENLSNRKIEGGWSVTPTLGVGFVLHAFPNNRIEGSYKAILTVIFPFCSYSEIHAVSL